MPGLAGMADSGGCAPKECVPPPTVDLVIGRRRLRLNASGFDIVWTASPVLPEGFVIDYSGAAFARSFSENCLIFVSGGVEGGDGRTAIFEVDLADGEIDPEEPLYSHDEPLGGVGYRGVALLMQEAGYSVAFALGEFEPESLLYTLTPEGLAELALNGDAEAYVGAFASLDHENFGGAARIADDLFYLVRSLVDGTKIYSNPIGGPDVAAVAFADLTTDIVSSNGPRMVYDDDAAVFYAVGYTTGGDLRVVEITHPSAIKTTLATFTGPTGLIEFLTLLDDGIYFMTGRSDLWRYSLASETVELLLHRATAGAWDDIDPETEVVTTARVEWVGWGFIVGADYTCNQACECGPTVELERLLEEPPEVEYCEDPDEPADATCCETADPLTRCVFLFAYAVTLCEGRTLKAIVVQGARGRVSIQEYDAVEGEWVFFAWLDEVTDFATVPLIGRLLFVFADNEDEGPHTGTLRITFIDSADCCTRLIEELECCNCGPPVGDATFDYDTVPPEIEAVYGSTGVCTGPFGTDACGNFAHHYCYFKLTFGLGSFTDCAPVDPYPEGESPICYRVHWDGMKDRAGDALPLVRFYYPGQEERFRWDSAGDGFSSCVAITPMDGRGCPGETTYLAFRGAYGVPPGTDISLYPPCQQERITFFACPPEE